MSDSATPGWYYAQGDPAGTERYWDGSAWTEGPRPVAGAMADPASGLGTDVPANDSFGISMPGTTSGTEAPAADFGSTMPDTTIADTSGFNTETPSGFNTETPTGFGAEPPSAPPVGAPMADTTGAFGSPAPGAMNPTQDGFGVPAPVGAFPGAPASAAAAMGGGIYSEASKANTAVICSIAGAVLVVTVIGAIIGVPLAIAGAIIGNGERKAIDEGRRDPSGRGKAMTALIVGAIVAVLSVLALLPIIALIIFA